MSVRQHSALVVSARSRLTQVSVALTRTAKTASGA
jgi:hypothetical protein